MLLAGVLVTMNLLTCEGEIKGGKVSGFHNWIQFYLLEKRGALNYYSHSFNGPVGLLTLILSMMVHTVRNNSACLSSAP